jgi:cytochrome c
MRSLLVVLLPIMLVACGPSAPQGDGAAPGASEPAATQAAPSNEEMQARIAALPAPYNEATYDAGRRVFAQCRSCHTINEGDPNRVGPNLHGVFGREIGSVEGFSYSQPVQDANFTWDAEQLDHWLQNPQTFLPGNRMAFAGVRDETQRRDLIAYLMVETAD